MKKILFIMRSAPHQGIYLQEKLDIILTAAAFDQQVALLFLDEGVFQLKKGQQAEKQGLKETEHIFNALDMYDVNLFYVEAESLQDRGLKRDDLSLSTVELPRQQVNGLMQQYDIIVSG